MLQVPRWEGSVRLRLGETDDVEQGETVLALGYPAGAGPGEEASSTRGVVSAARTLFRDPAPDVPAYPEAIRTDTALDPGFSGGPLVDLDRNVVGVNAAARTTGEDGRPLQGANYAIAADRARGVLDALRAGRSRAGSARTSAIPPRRTSPRAASRRASSCSARWPAHRRRWPGSGDGRAAHGGRRAAVGRTLGGWCAATRGIAERRAGRAHACGRRTASSRTVSLRFG